MRLDVAADGRLCRNIQVLVDGIPSQTCCMADEEQGCVEEYEESATGALILDDSLPRGFRTRMRWGQVEIVAETGHEEQLRLLRGWKAIEAGGERSPQ